MKLTMSRSGSFTCNWTNTDNKCGPGQGVNPLYTYQCHIEAGDILDKNGFIFDQLQIDEYFQKKYSKNQAALSCERIAANAVKDVKLMIEKHMMGHSGMSMLYRIAVTIGIGNRGPATMTAEWVPESKPVTITNVKKVKKQITHDIRVKRFEELKNRIEKGNAVWDDILEHSRLKALLK